MRRRSLLAMAFRSSLEEKTPAFALSAEVLDEESVFPDGIVSTLKLYNNR
jgi:hypothetical protein